MEEKRERKTGARWVGPFIPSCLYPSCPGLHGFNGRGEHHRSLVWPHRTEGTSEAIYYFLKDPFLLPDLSEVLMLKAKFCFSRPSSLWGLTGQV